jgi:dihydrofolate reductase
MKKPRLSIVVAMDRNRVIGRDGDLPWRLPADLRHFRALTMGKPVVMGRRTHASIGRPLPGRDNIVVSRDPLYRADGCTVVGSLASACKVATAGEVMVIGGASLYSEALAGAARIYLTEVHAEVAGDVRFPDFDRAEWRESERTDHPADAANDYPYSFVLLERRSVTGAGAGVAGDAE